MEHLTNTPRAAMALPAADPDGVLRISCETCVMRATAACDDCLVTFLCDERGTRVDGGAVVFDLAEIRAVKMLADAGLVPTLRHRAAR